MSKGEIARNNELREANRLAILGWYARKGLISGLRGSVHRLRFGRAPFPFYLGSRTHISYARKIYLGHRNYIGDGSRILALSLEGIRFGDHVTLREGAWIQCASNPRNPGVGLQVGDNTYIGPSSIIGVGGPIRIGSGCQFGARVTLIAENHARDITGQPSATDVVRKGIAIGNNCWLGHGATILDGVELGDGCIVGAGSVVTRSFPAGTTVVGSPARAITR